MAKYGLGVDGGIRHALDDAKNESCKPGDAAFARAQFELIARPRNSLDAAVKLAKEAGYEIVDLGADLESEARDGAPHHPRLPLHAPAGRKQPAVFSGRELTGTVRRNRPGRAQ